MEGGKKEKRKAGKQKLHSPSKRRRLCAVIGETPTLLLCVVPPPSQSFSPTRPTVLGLLPTCEQNDRKARNSLFTKGALLTWPRGRTKSSLCFQTTGTFLDGAAQRQKTEFREASTGGDGPVGPHQAQCSPPGLLENLGSYVIPQSRGRKLTCL